MGVGRVDLGEIEVDAGLKIRGIVVAADDGVCPQSREHLDICKLLGVRHGLVADGRYLAFTALIWWTGGRLDSIELLPDTRSSASR